MRDRGIVSLVGAGPGACDLITLRGWRRLRDADFVLYDALVASELLDESRPDAERVFVGKRGYCVGSTVQGDINALLAQLAGAGKKVCRLKGGDPCVFGRGGEEAEYLAAHGVPFEIVPGVTAALALGGCGIPLTHRDVGPSVTLVTGHFDPDSPECTLDWEALARAGCVVFYMGLRHVAKIANRLAGAGLNPDTAAAVVHRLSHADEQVVTGTVADIAARVASSDVQAPALIVVGETVRRRERLLGLLEAHDALKNLSGTAA